MSLGVVVFRELRVYGLEIRVQDRTVVSSEVRRPFGQLSKLLLLAILQTEVDTSFFLRILV